MAGYTHRVAIANSRPITLNDRGVTFKWRDYRVKGCERYKTMTLETDKFIRRFLIRLDLLALSPTRRDQEGNPVPQFVDQLVMSAPAFLRMVGALGQTVKQMQEKGLMGKAEAEATPAE